jgi:hypothetical protein
VAETRWAVWTLPGGAVEQALKERALLMTLSVASEDAEVTAAIERAAATAGMTLTRLPPTVDA